MTDLLDVERLFTETIAMLGGVDVVVHASHHDSSVVDQQAARSLRPGGAIVHVARSNAIDPGLGNELRARNITVNEVALRSESPTARRDLADLVSLLDRWQRGTVRALTPASRHQRLRPRQRPHLPEGLRDLLTASPPRSTRADTWRHRIVSDKAARPARQGHHPWP
jgi:hypothetical protein